VTSQGLLFTVQFYGYGWDGAHSIPLVHTYSSHFLL